MCGTHASGFCFSDDLCCAVINRCYAYDKAGKLIQNTDKRSGTLYYVYDKIGCVQKAQNNQDGHSEKFALSKYVVKNINHAKYTR